MNKFFGRSGSNRWGWISLAVVAGLSSAVHGADWVNPSGGAWETPANWLNSAPPVPTDAANFDLGKLYNITLASSPIVSSIAVHDTINFHLPAGQNLQSTDFLVDSAHVYFAGGGFLTLGNLANANPTGAFTVNHGRLTIQSVGTELRTNNDLEMGTVPGDSHVRVRDTGVIGVRRLVAGVVPGSNALIEVSGNANNTLFKGKGHIIGLGGAATLNVTNEGRFNCDPLGTGPAITVGFGDGTLAGRGYVNVDGNISLMNLKGEVRVADGPGSIGTFRISNGGRAAFSGTNSVPIAMHVGRNGGVGQVWITGGGSNIKLNGQLLIDQNVDDHAVRAEAGGRIVASSVLYNGNSTFSKPGLVVKGMGAALETSGDVNIASGRMLITDTGILDSGGALRIGATPDAAAEVLFENGTFHTNSLVIDGGNVTLTPGANKIVRTGSVAFNTPDSGVVDLADNAMMVDYLSTQSSPIDQVRLAIAPGPNNPLSMARIVSSVAANDPARYALGIAEGSDLPDAGAGLRSFFREAADNTSVLVRFTLRGDADLNGEVNIGDFANLAANFGSEGRWFQGDFDHDGEVGIGDFALLATNFNEALPDHSSTGAARGVPEPASVSLIAAALLVSRRRRR